MLFHMLSAARSQKQLDGRNHIKRARKNNLANDARKIIGDLSNIAGHFSD